ncbi:Acg family FMN-binding oxidoreductase [Mycolicibacterium pulveris]|uniref:Acg family FMN-binding oxidoreductase n=1 Tax=Mycolicibacterium pulveris TaxID=36813 RepID=UPI003CF9FFF6
MMHPAVDSAAVANAVQLACRAPSLHNSQPWRWLADDNGLHLFADASRNVRGTDKSGRETLLSCGVVLDHLRVAMAVTGWATTVHRFPDAANRLHLSSIDFRPMDSVTDGDRRRADAILLRRTDRLPFAAPADWETFEPHLRNVVDSAAVRLDVIADDLRPVLATASTLTEDLRRYDSYYHDELHWWTAGFETAEGIPHSSLLSESEADRVDVARVFPHTQHGDRREHVERDRSKILALSTYDESRDSVLRCGERLSAVLLEATMAGLATCTLTHITEHPESRQVLAELIGHDTAPQALVRIGLAPSIEDVPPPTPRRALREVLQFRRSGA